MGRLEQRFEDASLRTKDRVTATITGVELTEYDSVGVTYHIGGTDAETIEAVDVFDIPTENSHEYGFVRLCEKADVPLVSAHDQLTGEVLEAGTTASGEWTLLPEFEDEPDESALTALREYGQSGRALTHAGYVATAVAFPLMVPAFVWYLYRDDWQESEDKGVGSLVVAAVIVVGLGLLLWWLGYAYLRILPYP